MVTIETPGFKPKRLLILEMNFLAPSTMSLNHDKDQIFVLGKNHDLKFCNERNFQPVTLTNYHYETTYSV